MTWGTMAAISFPLIDMFFISLLSTQPLAAISISFPFTMVIFSLVMGFSIAMSSVISRLIGEKQPETVRRVTSQGLLLVFLIGLAITALGLVFHNDIFVLMGAPPEMLPVIGDYMHIWL